MSIRIDWADKKSEQIKKVSGESSSFILPRDYEGRVRVSYFDYDSDGVSIGMDDPVALSQLPKGARIIDSRVRVSNTDTDTAASLMLYTKEGVMNTNFPGGISPVLVLIDGEVDEASLRHQSLGVVVPSHSFVVLEQYNSGGLPADFIISGYILYVVD